MRIVRLEMEVPGRDSADAIELFLNALAEAKANERELTFQVVDVFSEVGGLQKTEYVRLPGKELAQLLRDPGDMELAG